MCNDSIYLSNVRRSNSEQDLILKKYYQTQLKLIIMKRKTFIQTDIGGLWDSNYFKIRALIKKEGKN